MGNYAGQTNYGLHACCTFDADAAAAAFRVNRGFAAAFVRNGAGDYSLALVEGIGQNQAALVASSNGGAAAMIDVIWVDATHVRVRTMSNAAMAADIDFSLVIHDMGNT